MYKLTRNTLLKIFKYTTEKVFYLNQNELEQVMFLKLRSILPSGEFVCIGVT